MKAVALPKVVFVFKRITSLFLTLFISVSLIFTPSGVSAQAIFSTTMPNPGATVLPSTAFAPMTLKGVTIDPENPFNFDFLIDTGNEAFDADNVEPKAKKLIEYFLVSLATPEDDVWVNLSPYEKDRIMTDSLAQTHLGREMMAQDYLLKQFSSSLLHPDTQTGKAFWNSVYNEAYQQFGTTDIPVDTFHKVWIVPNKADVYVHDNTAYITDSSLKVLLEEDLETGEFVKGAHLDQSSEKGLSTQIMRDVILPVVEKEVNEGQHFASTRQIYNSIILASWYRDNVKQSLLNEHYANQKKLNALSPNEASLRKNIHSKYMEAFQKGVFNYIKEELDATTNEFIPRKYFSGGKVLNPDLAIVTAFPGTATPTGPVLNANSLFTSSRVVDQVDDDQDSAMEATEFELETAAQYWNGNLSTSSISFPFEGLGENDVFDVPEASDADRQRLELAGIQSVAKGEGAIGFLAAGASSRMATKLAPAEVKDMVNGKEVESKGGVPIGQYHDKVVNYFDAFGVSVSRYLTRVRSAFKGAGLPESTAGNMVFYMTNDAYEAEQAGILAENGNYGLENSIVVFKQPLGAKFFARPSDVEAYFKSKRPDKFKNTAEQEAFTASYEKAMAKAREVEAAFQTGNREALIVPGEPEPLGHGEFLHQLIASKTIVRMFDEGKTWVTTKNVDNYAAMFDPEFSIILGRFLTENLDAVFEMSPRSPGQKGGIGIKHANGFAVAEEPFLRATTKADGQMVLDPLDSHWINNATGIFSPRYIIAPYKRDGQSDTEFIEELRNANEAETLAIAERGRRNFSKILDVKPAKTPANEGYLTSKPETNLWSASLIVDPKEYSLEVVGVRGATNFDIDAYPNMAPDQKAKALSDLRFLATKQWEVSDADKSKKRKQLEEKRGGPVSDEVFALTLESYDGNRLLASDLLKHLYELDPVTRGLDLAMISSIAVDEIGSDVRELILALEALDNPDGKFASRLQSFSERVRDIRTTGETYEELEPLLVSQLEESVEALNRDLGKHSLLGNQTVIFDRESLALVLSDSAMLASTTDDPRKDRLEEYEEEDGDDGARDEEELRPEGDAAIKTTGGILFSREALDLNTQGGTIDIKVDQALIADIEKNGLNNLAPQIQSIRIVPLNQFFLKLGLRKEEETGELVSL